MECLVIVFTDGCTDTNTHVLLLEGFEDANLPNSEIMRIERADAPLRSQSGEGMFLVLSYRAQQN